MMERRTNLRNISGKELFSVAGILAVVLLSYFNALSNKFAYDDVPLVERNPIIRDWHNIVEIFRVGYWTPTGSGSGGLYRPLTTLSYLADFLLSGLNPFLYHLDNVILHFLVCVLVYLLVRRLTSSYQAGLVSALVFAAHPVHVEVVSNVIGRSELLASLFTLAALYTFINPVKRLPWYVVSPALMMAGLLSKETAIVLPVLILAYLLVYERDGRGRNTSSIIISLAPYALVTVVFMLARFFILADEVVPKGADQVLVYTKGYWRFLVMTRVFYQYLRLSLFPTDLRLHYMLRPPDSFLNPWTLLFVAVAVLFIVMSFRLYRKHRDYFFFALWFLIALLPVSNIIPIGILMGERAMYLPSVAVCAFAGMVFSYAAGERLPVPGAGRKAAAALLVAVIACMSALTHHRNPIWYDSVSIERSLIKSYEHVIKEFPESAQYYVSMSETYTLLHENDKALEVLLKGAEVEPGFQRVHIALARRYLVAKKFMLALSEARKALSISGLKFAADYALFADIFFNNGLFDEARKFMDKALDGYSPYDHELMNDISIILTRMKEYDKSEEIAKQAIELNPYVGVYHLNYASLLTKKGDYAAAGRELDIAEKLDPDLSEIYFQRGILYGSQGEYTMAVTQLEKAAAMDPNDAETRFYLAAAYHEMGQEERSIHELEETLRLNPEHEEARRILEEYR